MSKFNCVLALAVAATCVATASKAQTYIYTVNVTGNKGTPFTDCFTFANGILTVQGLAGLQLPFTAAPTTPKYYYTAVTNPKTSSDNYAIAFSGFRTGNNVTGKLKAVGADNYHNSYSVSGVSAPACPASTDSVAHGASLYRPAQN